MTGATVLTTLSDIEGEENVTKDQLGYAEEVYEEHIGDDDFIFIKGGRYLRAQSIFLRGCNEMYVDELERSINDSL